MNEAVVTPAGFEPAITGMKTLCPRPLDDGALFHLLVLIPTLSTMLVPMIAVIRNERGEFNLRI